MVDSAPAAAPKEAVDAAPAAEVKVEVVDPAQQLLNDLKTSVANLEKAVAAKDLRSIARILRVYANFRRNMPPALLERAIRHYIPESVSTRALTLSILSSLPTSSTVVVPPVDAEASGQPRTTVLPEVELFLQLLVLVMALDKKRNDDAVALSVALLERAKTFNRRTLDHLTAKLFFYLAFTHEQIGKLAEIRPVLLACYKTACLHHDELGQATLLNTLLRSYLSLNLFDQAHKLVSKTTFPESRSNNQYARYLYYLGLIRAVQLQYSEAFARLSQAIRKAPTSSAKGFRVTVNKLAIVVQLLMGEIPERSLFFQADMKGPLKPYLQITQAVRTGDLANFHEAMKNYTAVFQADHTLTLINRLRHNVIKTGLRRINVSYSRISLADIATKLHLDSAADAECIVAKAIRDGVIDAVIDHEQGFVQSKETIDLYSTQEPQVALHKRISFCLDLHNEAVKAMSFPPNAHREGFESAEQRRERLEQELASMEEDEEDDF